MKKWLAMLVYAVYSLMCISCEEVEDLGFPTKIELSGNGESFVINGKRDTAPYILSIEILDYDGNGNSGHLEDGADCIEATTDWLNVRYYQADNRLALTAAPNDTQKVRKLYVYLYTGYSRQEIKVVQFRQ